MSFGRPPSSSYAFNPTPPDRGSFPLDHDGECSSVMKEYLLCLKRGAGRNSEDCRSLAKRYLQCRMDNNLMDKDDFENLGLGK